MAILEQEVRRRAGADVVRRTSNECNNNNEPVDPPGEKKWLDGYARPLPRIRHCLLMTSVEKGPSSGNALKLKRDRGKLF